MTQGVRTASMEARFYQKSGNTDIPTIESRGGDQVDSKGVFSICKVEAREAERTEVLFTLCNWCFALALSASVHLGHNAHRGVL